MVLYYHGDVLNQNVPSQKRTVEHYLRIRYFLAMYILWLPAFLLRLYERVRMLSAQIALLSYHKPSICGITTTLTPLAITTNPPQTLVVAAKRNITSVPLPRRRYFNNRSRKERTIPRAFMASARTSQPLMKLRSCSSSLNNSWKYSTTMRFADQRAFS